MENEITKEYIEKMKQIDKMIKRSKDVKRNIIPNWEVDAYYERHIKKFDTE